VVRCEPRPNGASSKDVASVGDILGSYRITGELSRGGMGAVYLATHEVLGRTAAVKLLRPELTSDPALVTRFVNEAKAASAIRHPGIIEVLDFGHTDDGRAFLVMELLAGETLSRRIAARGRLADAEATAIARGIASALTAAHDKGIVHRDLKPDNIFLVPDPDTPGGERPKLLDFGIAKLSDPGAAGAGHTQTGALMGTPTYMAPEQARAARAIDHRADLYSLGCILYEMLVGEPPFVAIGAGELIALHMFETPEPPRARVAAISPRLEQVVLRLLAKEPDERFHTAAALVAALDERRESAGGGDHAGSAGGAGGGAPRGIDEQGEAKRRVHTQARSPGTLTAPIAGIEVRARRPAWPLVAAVVALALALAASGVFVVTRDDPAPPPSTAADRPPPVETLAPAPSPPPAPDLVPVHVDEPSPEPPAPARRKPARSPTAGPASPATTPKGSPIETDL
jgi:eukaryotic-like serine/threonine-protein kinase